MKAAPRAVPAAPASDPLSCGLSPAINHLSVPRLGKLREQDPLLSLRVCRGGLFTVKNVPRSCSFNLIDEHMDSDGSRMSYYEYAGRFCHRGKK